LNGLLVAGTSSSVGKTTVAMAILAAMRLRGLAVQPFKGGPDFLDTGHLSRIAGRTARNLDTWMLSPAENLIVLQHAAHGADAIVVEGMMGLFDGKDGATEIGSSAEIAKLLKLPVVLVIDAGKSARSVAAVVLGFEMFDPEVVIAGVALNRVASERHYRMLDAAISSRCRTPVLGWLPRDQAIAIPERHLGLQTAEEADSSSDAITRLTEKLATLVQEHFDVERVLSFQCGLSFKTRPASLLCVNEKSVRIGVASDAAFSFYYEDNLDLMREQGAEIIRFSPMADEELPDELDALYLGGGYPELYTRQLCGNRKMMDAVRKFTRTGRPVYAECGGMMYLATSLKTLDQISHEMSGVLPLAIEMTSGLVQFGYVTVRLTRDTMLGRHGTELRGHSFHHSRIINTPELTTAYQVRYSLSGKDEAEGYSLGNVLASYLHLHFRAQPSIAAHFVAAALAAKSSRMVMA
jgi:cobyrinic acid a,c-diamide synthase